MNYVFAVFSTRFSTLNFARTLGSHNIPVAIVNTPHGIGRACGISVKLLGDYLEKAQSLLQTMTNFVGFFTYVGQGQLIKI